MERGGAFGNGTDAETQAGRVEQRPLLPLARRADHEVNRHGGHVDSIALQGWDSRRQAKSRSGNRERSPSSQSFKPR